MLHKALQPQQDVYEGEREVVDAQCKGRRQFRSVLVGKECPAPPFNTFRLHYCQLYYCYGLRAKAKARARARYSTITKVQ